MQTNREHIRKVPPTPRQSSKAQRVPAKPIYNKTRAHGARARIYTYIKETTKGLLARARAVCFPRRRARLGRREPQLSRTADPISSPPH